ncbi:hypothetical protein RhiirB3_435304 [Rhizophagus irregularis]|nr:hypothetical protein RhiirB3_435304 [Rhizophagus irregularis]
MHTINNKDDVEVDKEPSFDEYIQIIESTSKILKEQKDAGNIEWLKKVEKNFKPLKKIIKDIESYNKQHTMPRTWKDYNTSSDCKNMINSSLESPNRDELNGSDSKELLIIFLQLLDAKKLSKTFSSAVNVNQENIKMLKMPIFDVSLNISSASDHRKMKLLKWWYKRVLDG